MGDKVDKKKSTGFCVVRTETIPGKHFCHLHNKRY